jgi:hypothetical protein
MGREYIIRLVVDDMKWSCDEWVVALRFLVLQVSWHVVRARWSSLDSVPPWVQLGITADLMHSYTVRNIGSERASTRDLDRKAHRRRLTSQGIANDYEIQPLRILYT